MSCVIHVPCCERRGPAQARTTSANAVLTRISAVDRRSSRSVRLDICKSPGRNTQRGLGDHHKRGWPSSYHGKMPLRYAYKRRSVLRSPPAASKPSGSRSAAASGGKFSGGSSGLSQKTRWLVTAVRRDSCRGCASRPHRYICRRLSPLRSDIAR